MIDEEWYNERVVDKLTWRYNTCIGIYTGMNYNHIDYRL